MLHQLCETKKNLSFALSWGLNSGSLLNLLSETGLWWLLCHSMVCCIIFCFTSRASPYIRHSGWNQNSQIWTHQTKVQNSTGPMTCSCVFGSSFFFVLFSYSPEQLTLKCVCCLNSVNFLF